MQTIKKIISAAMNIDISQFSLLLLLLWILVMYGHSLTPAVLSSQESSRALLLVRQLFLSAGVEAAWLTEHMVRKGAHFGEYCIFGILLVFYLKNRPKRRYGHRQWELELLCPAALAVVLVPFLDETIQLFVAGRSAQVTDVWLDIAGSCFGILLCQIPALLGIRFNRTKPRRPRKW